MIWNKARECMSRDELADLQGKRLVKLVEYMYQNAAYYRKKMQKLGLEPGDIQGIGDLEKLPFTTKEDLTEAYPLGVFAMSDSKIVRYYSSNHKDAHYAGMETVAGYTQNDIEVSKECMARSISMAGLGEKDVIQVAYEYGSSTEGLDAHYGAERVGAAVVSGFDDKPMALLALMRRLHVTGVISTASQLMRVTQAAEKKDLKNSLQLKAAICGGESWSGSMRERLQTRLGIKVYDIFGLNELTGLGVACECECQKGLHIQEDFFLAEVVDRNTLLVLSDGKKGELVFTTLQKEGIPLIRYRTRNLTRIHYEKCECGRTMARIDRVCGGTDDMLLIRGKSVFAFQIEEALSELEDFDIFYLVYIREEHACDVVDIYIESDRINEELLPEGGRDMKHRVADAVCHIIGMMPKVQFGSSAINELPDTERKKVIIIDERRF